MTNVTNENTKLKKCILQYFTYITILIPVEQKIAPFTNSAVYLQHMSLVMRKPAFCICENKDADQLCGNCEADQRLCFRCIASKILFFLNLKFQAIFCDCTARFVSDKVINPEDRFSHNEAHMNIPDSLKNWKMVGPVDEN